MRLPFVEAAEVFGPQKGASPAQVELLRRRLERLAQVYLEEHGVDVRDLEGAGAAGGLAGGLAAVGASLESGFDLVADAVDLDERMERCDLVVTGEGFVDEQSFDGKVVGGVVAMAAELGVPVLVVAGEVMDPLPEGVDAVSLTERFGGERSRLDPLACVEEVVADHLRTLGSGFAVRRAPEEDDEHGHDPDDDQQLGQREGEAEDELDEGDGAEQRPGPEDDQRRPRDAGGSGAS